MSGKDTALARARLVRDCLLRHGVPEVSIELQVGRPTSGDAWNALQPIAVMSHHIASKPTPANPTPGLALVKRGRADLPGPLANGTAGVDLVYRILTLGLANHPGEGGPMTVSGPCGSYRIPKDVARPFIWGTEYEGGYDDATWDRVYVNKRTGKKMTFREFMGRVNAGLVEAIWLINGKGKKPVAGADLSGYHMEHKTWAPGRKPDRLHYTTESGRKEIQTYDVKKPAIRYVNLQNMIKAQKGQIKTPLQGVNQVKAALNKELNLKEPMILNGLWGKRLTTLYKHWESMNNLPANGIPDERSLTLLGKRGNRFRVSGI